MTFDYCELNIHISITICKLIKSQINLKPVQKVSETYPQTLPIHKFSLFLHHYINKQLLALHLG
jgi:hypothetical protein